MKDLIDRSSHRKCSVRKGVRKIYRKTPASEFFFIKLQASVCNFIKKKDSGTALFLWIFKISKKTSFHRTPRGDSFWFEETMNVKRFRFLCLEIYKTINNLSPSFMKQIFELRETNRNVPEKYRLNLNIPNYNHVTFGKKSLWTFGPKFGTAYHTTLNLQKIFKLSKLLSKTGTVLIASVWCVKSYKPYFYLFSPFFYSLLQ